MPVTVDDVIFSYQLAMRDGSAWREDLERLRLTVRPFDERTVQFVTSPLRSALPDMLLLVPIVSRSAYERDPDAFARHPIGAGPFAVTDFAPGERVALDAHRGYVASPRRGSTESTSSWAGRRRSSSISSTRWSGRRDALRRRPRGDVRRQRALDGHGGADETAGAADLQVRALQERSPANKPNAHLWYLLDR